MSSLEDKPRADGLGRFLLALAMLLGPAIYLARLALSEPTTSPAPERPLWAQCVLLTAGRWPLPATLPKGPYFEGFDSASIDAGGAFLASDQPGPSAVSLWTGRFVANHGVEGPDQALPEGAWTLANSARASGASTAAFIEADWISRHHLGGFETVEESLLGEDLLPAMRRWVLDHAGQRKLLWLHIDKPGLDGARLEAAMAAVQSALVENREQFETLTVFTAFVGPERAEGEFALRVPLRVELPSLQLARTKSETQLSQIDLAGGLVKLMRWPWPSIESGQRALQSRWRSMFDALQGGSAVEPIWIDGKFGKLARFGDLRVLATPSEPGAAPRLELWRLPRWSASPSEGRVLSVGEAKTGEERYVNLRAMVLAGASASVPGG